LNPSSFLHTARKGITKDAICQWMKGNGFMSFIYVYCGYCSAPPVACIRHMHRVRPARPCFGNPPLSQGVLSCRVLPPSQGGQKTAAASLGIRCRGGLAARVARCSPMQPGTSYSPAVKAKNNPLTEFLSFLVLRQQHERLHRLLINCLQALHPPLTRGMSRQRQGGYPKWKSMLKYYV
jgi:hypothetical protein